MSTTNEPRTYSIRYRDGSGVTTTVTCTPSELDEAVEDDVRGGDWGMAYGTIYVDVDVICAEDGTEERRTIVLQPDEPACAPGEEHDWQSPHEVVGGIEENPGVRGHGGGVLIHEVCARCGAYRHTDTWATRRDTGQQGLTEVRYEPPDDESLAWISTQPKEPK